MYIDKLDDFVNKYNNTYSTIKMKPGDVKSNTYTNSNKEINDRDLKFKIGDIVRISKYKKICGKGYVPNLSQEDIVIKRIENTVLRTYVISDRKGKKHFGTFYKKELQKSNQKNYSRKSN